MCVYNWEMSKTRDEMKICFWRDKVHLEKNNLDIILNCYQVGYTSNISKPTLTHKRLVYEKKT
jgi:hypothetical protein